MLTDPDIARWLVEYRPGLLLQAADWTYWPGEDATVTLHTRACPNPMVKDEWFDQANAVLVKSMPGGKMLCLQCAITVMHSIPIGEFAGQGQWQGVHRAATPV